MLQNMPPLHLLLAVVCILVINNLVAAVVNNFLASKLSDAWYWVRHSTSYMGNYPKIVQIWVGYARDYFRFIAGLSEKRKAWAARVWQEARAARWTLVRNLFIMANLVNVVDGTTQGCSQPCDECGQEVCCYPVGHQAMTRGWHICRECLDEQMTDSDDDEFSSPHQSQNGIELESSSLSSHEFYKYDQCVHPLCQRTGEYPRGCTWGNCCKRCFISMSEDPTRRPDHDEYCDREMTIVISRSQYSSLNNPPQLPVHNEYGDHRRWRQPQRGTVNPTGGPRASI